jgi:hypothetical protein
LSQCKEVRTVKGIIGELHCVKKEHGPDSKHLFHLDMTAEEIDALNVRLEKADREISIREDAKVRKEQAPPGPPAEAPRKSRRQ